jgi:nucleotide-binding universal stress UspA family protein
MDMTSVLVVANRTADSEELFERLVDRHREGAISVTLLAPAVWEVEDPHGGRESALRRLRSAKRRLQAQGIEVSCVLGDPDPMAAFQQEWKRGGYDEVVVSTLPGGLSKWLRVDLPSRIKRATDGKPTTHVVAAGHPARSS